MPIQPHKEAILAPLRSRSVRLRDEHILWQELDALATYQQAKDPTLAVLVYRLAVIYTRYTGALPGYTKSDSQTVFEKFADAFLRPLTPRATENQIRSTLHAIDPKRNKQFDLDVRGAP